MKRNYTDRESDEIQFFVGVEVEHTPAFGLPTLFVVGIHSVEEIEEWLDKVTLKNIKHIFFGANHSFHPSTTEEWENWESIIQFFLEKGYLCSLDIPTTAVEDFNENGLNEFDNFIPQIRVSIPYVKLWNYNTMIKIDDRDFKATNPGVWTHSLHKLMDRDVFTDWSEYNNDKVLK